MDYETVLANFEGLTFFEIFAENPEYIELIHKQIEDNELESKKTIEASGNESDNIIIRRLFWTLQQPILN